MSYTYNVNTTGDLYDTLTFPNAGNLNPASVYTIGTTTAPPYTINTTSSPYQWATITNGQPSLKIEGDAEFNGEVKVKGKSLLEAIENIEKRLAILHPNAELEEKWERLKSLGDMYRELEKEILEKEQIWSTLKK